jgi:glucosamine--fructose-6-phosphate aminotransferase (isomerizing)
MQNEIPASLSHIFERKAHPFHMWDGIQSIAAGIEDIRSSNVLAAINDSAASILEKSPIHLMGCGTSYFAGIAIAHAIQSIANLAAYPWQAFEFLAYPPIGIQNSTIVGISHTGGTPPVVRAVEMGRKLGACTVAYSDGIPSALTRASEWVIPSTMGAEPALPKTRSYTSTLMRGYLHSVALAGFNGKETSSWEAALRRAPELARQVIAANEAQARDLANRWVLSRRVVVSGGGPQHATALEGMLKLTEASMFNATSWEIEEAVHGTWASTVEEDLIILLAMEGPSFDATVRLAGGMKAIGSKVWVLTNRAWKGVKVDVITQLPEGEPEVFMPLYAILPIYLFSYFSALAKNLAPDTMRLSDPRFLQARMQMRSSLP